MPSNILTPHEIQQLIDKLEQQAIEAETKAIAKKYVNHFDARTEYTALSMTAALLRSHIQELSALLHQ
jgi:hypothetical protein